MNAPVKTPPETLPEAFLRLQASIKPAIKDATNPAFRSKYADLGAVWEAVKEPLQSSGFAIIQTPDFDGADMWLKTTILHVSGEKIEGRYPIRPMKLDPQGYGSALTYARRYSISAMLGVIADDDDDGNAASTPGAKPTPAPAKPQHDPDPDGQAKAWCDQQKAFLTNCETVADVTAWEELRADGLDRLRRKSTALWSDLTRFKENRIGQINMKVAK